jgi:hypothetical protein
MYDRSDSRACSAYHSLNQWIGNCVTIILQRSMIIVKDVVNVEKG